MPALFLFFTVELNMLKIITPATSQCIAPADMASYLHLDVDSNGNPYEEDVLQSMILAATAMVENYAGITVNNTTIQYTCDPALGYIKLPYSTPYDSVQHTTVTSVTSYYQGMAIVIDPSCYILYDNENPARLMLKIGCVWPYPHDYVSVVYSTGYGSTDTAVPERIKQAVMVTAAYLYRNRDQPAASAMPEMAKALVEPYVNYSDYALNDKKYAPVTANHMQYPYLLW